jgi:hypothetical protein
LPKTKKKSAIEDSMSLSDYSLDEDDAALPKKTDWSQREMNSDEDSFDSCDKDSSSDEDDEWEEGME